MSTPTLLQQVITKRVATLKKAIEAMILKEEKILFKLRNYKRTPNVLTYEKLERFRAVLKYLAYLHYSWLSIERFYIKPAITPIRGVANDNLKSFCDLKTNMKGLTKFTASEGYQELIKKSRSHERIKVLPAQLILPTKYGFPSNITLFLKDEVDNLCLWNGGIYKEVIKNVKPMD